MPPKRSKKPPATQALTPAPATATEPTLKPSRTAWKTGEQYEYMLTFWPEYLTYQDEKALERFWPQVFDGWYRRWPTIPSIQAIGKHGSPEAAVKDIRRKLTKRIRTWFHNRTRPTAPKASTGKSDLRLNQQEKRKLAPAQAYCAYAWDSGLKDLVTKRWEEQKLSYMVADDDDPATDSIEPSNPCSHIPINFKLKIAKEAYSLLSAEEKKRVDDRREEERKKLYRGITEIGDGEERDRKLLSHQQNQPSVPKSLLRILKNLEDQAGCVAQLLVAYVDPLTGKTSYQNFCQGKTESGLEFRAFCGRDWDDVIEKRFKEWGMRVFGETDSARRSVFMFSNGIPPEPEATSSSAPHSTTVEEPEFQLEVDTSAVEDDEVIETPTVDPPLQIPETMSVDPPQTLVPPPLVSQPPVAVFQAPGSGSGISVSPQIFNPPQYVEPKAIFPPPHSVKSANNFYHPIIPPMTAEPPAITPPVLESSQTATPDQIVPPVAYESAFLVAPPVLESSQTATPDQTVVSPVAREPAFLVTPPVLESSQTATPDQIIVPPVAREPALLAAPPIPEFSQPITPHQAAVISPANPSPVLEPSQLAIPHQAVVVPPINPSPVLESSHSVTSHQVDVLPVVRNSPPVNSSSINGPPCTVALQQPVVSQDRARQRDLSPRVIQEPQTATVYHSSNPAEATARENSRATVATRSAYKSRGDAGTTAAVRMRRDSIEGAPDIILSLGGSGYELVTPSSRKNPLDTYMKNNMNTSTASPSSPLPSISPLSTPSYDDLIVPSSQQSIEGCLTIPMEVEMTIPTTPSVDQLVVPQHSPEVSILVTPEATTTVSTPFTFAPRVIPTYAIDKSDFPSWLFERGRLDYVLSVEAGEVWEKLITTWLRQERRLGFGLNEKLGSKLSMKEKPGILKDYFKWHHNPSKGDSVTLPKFGEEMSTWWTGIQPKWRYKNESSPDNKNDYSFILAGGKKGIFLLILCLAWWDRAYGRDLEKEKARRREAARTAGKDGVALNFNDLREHEAAWFNIVNDLIFVMELARGWPLPGENTPGGVAASSAQKKRAIERDGGSSPRKKVKSS